MSADRSRVARGLAFLLIAGEIDVIEPQPDGTDREVDLIEIDETSCDGPRVTLSGMNSVGDLVSVTLLVERVEVGDS